MNLAQTLFQVSTTFPAEDWPEPPAHRFEVKITYDDTGLPDGDYSQDCLDAGTTFTLESPIQSDPIPVKSAIVKDGTLTFTGIASWAAE